MKRTGLLTGTFDPVHRGHVELAKAAMRAGGLDGVRLLVNAAPGHKSGVAPYADRLAMARLAVDGVPGLSVYDGPLAREPHVAATFAALAGELAGEEPVFVVGVDTLARLDRWDDVESVVRNATYMAARRDGEGEREVEALRRRLGELGAELRVQLFDFEPAAEASSARIRAAVRAGEQAAFLQERVADYIREHGVYR